LNVDKLENIPSQVAMLILIGCIVVFRKRHPQMQSGGWVIGLVIIFISQLSWFFTSGQSPFYPQLHTLRLIADLLAGMAFLSYDYRNEAELIRLIRYRGWNVLTLILLLTLYGKDVTYSAVYIFCAVLGIVVVCLTGEIYGIARRSTAAWALVWVVVGVAAGFGHYRAAAYFVLASVYGAASVSLWNRLPRLAIGRVVLTSSFAVFAVVFLTHAWVMSHPNLRAVADQIWGLEKSFIAIGVLIVLLEQEIKTYYWLTVHDDATGLGNRRMMVENLQQVLDGGCAGLLIINLDGFKEVRNNLGRTGCDVVIQRLVMLLNQLIEKDESITRIGEDEFAIVSPRNLYNLCSSISALVSQPMAVENHEVRLHACVGSAFSTEDADGSIGRHAVMKLIRSADRRVMKDMPRGENAFVRTGWPKQSGSQA
jgi:diguanylate cyclase